MDQDLEKLKQAVEAKKEALDNEETKSVAKVEEPKAPVVDFSGKTKTEESTPVTTNGQAKDGNDMAGKMVNSVFQQGVQHVVTTDESVQGEILDTAKYTVRAKVEALANQATVEVQESSYNANKDACENYGVENSVPLWKIRLMRAGSAFWFVIYFIFASVTVAPITIFLKGLSGVIKKVWLAAIVAVVFYLVIAVGIPLLLAWVPA